MIMELELTIEKLVSKGEGLARFDGKTFFVRDALPGETVVAEVTEQKSDFARAETVRVAVSSENRVKPACPYYGECGGCDLQHASSESQTSYKEEIVKENFRRIGAVDIDDPELGITLLPPASDQSWGYRSRVRFHVDLETGRCGFLGRKSSDLVDIHHCPILCDSLNRLLDEKRPLLLKAAQMRRASEGWQSRYRYVQVPAFAGDDKVSLSSTEVSVDVAEKTIWADSNVFFQSNRFLISQMVDFVKSYAVGSTVIDLFAGVGTFSAFVESPEVNVIAVERDSRCLALAQKNLTNTEFFTQKAEYWSKKRGKDPVDTVIVDPPRTGLDKQLVETISSWNPQVIIYMSCDSVTQARDIKRFGEHGYRVKVLQVFDLYPQTSHIESGVCMYRVQS